MNIKELLLSAEMVDKKCRNGRCIHFSYCGCLKCGVFYNKPNNCDNFIPTKPKPVW